MVANDWKELSRRRLLQGAAALAAATAVPWAVTGAGAEAAQAEGPAPLPPLGEDYYAKLGVPTIINAAGTYTYLTAAVMPAPVRMAVERAALHPVVLDDLQRAAGRYIAGKLRCESALVTSGASAALTLATAACVMAANGVQPEQIPQKMFGAGRKNEVVVQKAHRYEYDHAMQLCGVSIVEVVTEADYRRALNERTVMTNFFNAAEGGEIDRETWLRIAHEHNVPCHIDAAADVPPIENLWKYTGMGFDLVCFSGGKGLRGPQNAGLLLGSRRLIELAMQNDSPNSEAVGRGMKVAKEQIVGMVAAVDWILAQDDAADEREYLRQAHLIAAMVKDIPTMQMEIYTPPIANHVPHLILTYDAGVVGITPLQVQARLHAGHPQIELSPATGTGGRLGTHSNEHTIVLSTWMLLPGEAEVVGQQLRTVLLQAKAGV